MKIVFLSGSLEPGRDGVGDYLRRLAGQLLSMGHQVGAISLNDAYVNSVTEAWQPAEFHQLQVIRFPSVHPAKERFKQAGEWINKFDPEWLSLQFVPFAFHPKGLSIQLGNFLKTLGAGRKWHLMMHELWVGMNKESEAKLIWWGRLQRILIRSLLQQLKPRLIHTQTRLYQMQVEGLGFKAYFLPLYSNIPVVAAYQISVDPGQGFRFVIFGSIHGNAPVDTFAREAVLFSKKHDRPVQLSIIGRCGNEQERWARIFREHSLPVELHGEQPAEEVSKLLCEANFGISTTAFSLVEKSGAAAAMREHGLPVICVAPKWTPLKVEHPVLPTDILQYKEGNLEECLSGPVIRPVILGLPEVGSQFIAALEAARQPIRGRAILPAFT